ncbi:ArnT family glycosyltransferase [Pseudopedobacter beijingensis]|uniref:ArnT family glycosyltransferase n=1 Tax=Pseudopedobacter beijingensis TaxID=1207056 RepID=A0ABW4IBZ0_9SPHI
MEYRIKLRWLILFATLIRCVCALLVELGNDEVYYYTYALQLDWNHFDHPPIVGIVIRFFTLNLHWINTFSMRFGAIIIAAINTWLIARTGTLLRNQRTGFIAAIIYNVSIYTSIIAGLFILPDSPAVFFWLASLYCMLKIILNKEKKISRTLIWLGFFIGLAIMSKVHGVFLWLGFVIYILLYQKNLLFRKQLYISIFLTIIIILPIFLWNLKYDFITWKFHGDRVNIKDNYIHFNSLFTAIAGQLFYNNPLLIVLYTIALLALRKANNIIPANTVRLLLCCAIPIILATTLIALFRPILPHWSGPGFIPFMLLTATWIDWHLHQTRTSISKPLLNSALYFTLVILFSGVLLIRLYPGNLSGANEKKELGKGDFSLDMTGWEKLGIDFSKFREQDVIKDKMNPDAVILINKWFPGGHLYFYVARPLNIPTIGVGNLSDLHKFVWLNVIEGNIKSGGDAYFIVPSNNFDDPKALYHNLFHSIELATILHQKRGNKTIRHWYIYRLKNAKAPLGSLY